MNKIERKNIYLVGIGIAEEETERIDGDSFFGAVRFIMLPFRGGWTTCTSLGGFNIVGMELERGEIG